MKKFIVFYFLVSCFIYRHCQAQTIFTGPEQSFNFRNGEFDILGRVGDKIYTYTSDNKGYYLNAYNDSMRLLSIVSLDFFPKKTSVNEIVCNQSNILVFYQAEEKNYIMLYGALLDKDAKIIGKPVVIESIKQSWLGANDTTAIKASSDKKYIAILRYKNNSKIDEIKAQLYDDSLHKIASNNIKIDSNKPLQIDQMEVSNNGIIFLASMATNKEVNLNGNFSLWKSNLLTKQTSKSVFPFNNKYPTTLTLQVDRSKDVCYIGGLYSDTKYGDVAGVFYGSSTYNDVPVKGSNDEFKTIEFADSVFTKYGSRKSNAFNNFNADNLIIKNNGGFLLLAEDYSIANRNVYASPSINFGYYPFYSSESSESITNYYYNDIAVWNFDGAGNILWNQYIRKNQVTENDGGLFSSYGFLNSGGSLVFIFNNFIKNNSAIQLAAVDINGVLQMQRLNINTENIDWQPRAGKQIGIKEIILPYFKRNSVIGFGRLQF